MAQLTASPRGTQDVLMGESHKWQYIEKKLSEVCERYGYREIRVPTFEHTELFTHGVGDTTDVVGKEMYTMLDKGGRSITLRPEGTAGVARAFIQNGVLAGPLPVRAYYLLSCFRHEKPQAGRLREFHQLGIELFGCERPEADSEVIRVADTILRELGIRQVRLEINSIGCPKCRESYRAALKEYFSQYESQLCETCRERLERNPLRLLDCKSPVCSKIAAGAPSMLDYLCAECADHFSQLKALLSEAGLKFEINPRIVRGLDYYTRTVFEFVHTASGAQGTVCGGGRYDGLAKLLGGADTPAVGFGLGLERLLMVMEAEKAEIPPQSPCDLFIAYIGERGETLARRLSRELIGLGLSCLYDINGRSLKAQSKLADKTGARYMLVLGDDEVKSGSGRLKLMSEGSEREAPLESEALAEILEEN
ncbi:MAG: histidine--tRNA ligase [Oscillospiraceae bacterium]|nr:histidine--tRNA ligase [Oscillospiraceae bacterium]